MFQPKPRINQPTLIYGGSALGRAGLLTPALMNAHGDWLILDGQGDPALADALLGEGVALQCQDFTPADLLGGGGQKPAGAVLTGRDYWAIGTEDPAICLGIQRRLATLPAGLRLVVLDPPKPLYPVLRDLLRRSRMIWAGQEAAGLHQAIGKPAMAAQQAVFFRVGDIPTLEALARWGAVHLPTATNLPALHYLLSEQGAPVRAGEIHLPAALLPALTGTAIR